MFYKLEAFSVSSSLSFLIFDFIFIFHICQGAGVFDKLEALLPGRATRTRTSHHSSYKVQYQYLLGGVFFGSFIAIYCFPP